MTRIPIPVQIDVEQDDFSKGIIFFPIVGLVVGLFSAAIYYIACYIKQGLFAVCMSVLAQTIITGGFHVDGLGDSFDALFSDKDKEKMLDILKDSRMGANGVLAIVFSILLKVFLLDGLTPPYIYKGIIAAPILGRLGIVMCASISKYARPTDGLGRLFTEGVGTDQLVISSLLTMVMVFYLFNYKAFIFIITILLFSLLISYRVQRKLCGITGDILGMINELSEILFLVLMNILV